MYRHNGYHDAHDIEEMFDGDTLSFSLVYAHESVQEIDKLLNSWENYISPQGDLTLPVTSDVTDWVLSFGTGNGLD